MSEHNVGPRKPCPNCGSSKFLPKLSAPQVCVSGGGSASTPFPIKVKVGKQEVIFTSKSHQDEYMNRHGLARYSDGEDSSTSSSQHSVYDQRDSAPSPLAERMAQQSFFVESPQDL